MFVRLDARSIMIDESNSENNKKMLDFMSRNINIMSKESHTYTPWISTSKIIFQFELTDCEPLEFHFNKHQSGPN
jgi:hypothetical protein